MLREDFSPSSAELVEYITNVGRRCLGACHIHGGGGGGGLPSYDSVHLCKPFLWVAQGVLQLFFPGFDFLSLNHHGIGGRRGDEVVNGFGESGEVLAGFPVVPSAQFICNSYEVGVKRGLHQVADTLGASGDPVRILVRIRAVAWDASVRSPLDVGGDMVEELVGLPRGVMGSGRLCGYVELSIAGSFPAGVTFELWSTTSSCSLLRGGPTS